MSARQLDMWAALEREREPSPSSPVPAVDLWAGARESRREAEAARSERLVLLRQHFAGGYRPENDTLPADGGKPGHLRPALLEFDRALWGRWDWWLDVLLLGLPGDAELAAIPQIEFASVPHPAAQKMLMRCTEHLQAAGLHSWEATRYLLEWIRHGLRGTEMSMRRLEKAERQVRRDFALGLLQLWPADYAGWMLCELGHGKRSGFFPTPLSVTVLMAQMTYQGVEADLREQTVCDPAVGTGAMLLAASNYCLNLYGQDIDAVALCGCDVNIFLYAPWGAMPHPRWGKARTGEVSP